MKRLALFLIGAVTPHADREWVLGDTVEELERLERADGARAARRWLAREVCHVCAGAIAHRLAVRYRQRSEVSRREESLMSAMRQDVGYAIRVLKRSPAYAIVAIATLAIGIGANTAMFAVVNGVLLKPLPFAEADRLMLVHLLAGGRDETGPTNRQISWSYPKYRTFLDAQTVFEDAAVFAQREVSLTDVDSPERVRVETSTDRYFAVLGISPILGRTFTSREANVAGTPPVAVIGERLWRRQFGGDPGIIGRTVHVDRNPYTVVGVLPRAFRGLGGRAELWLPVAAYESRVLNAPFNHTYLLVARRRPAVSEEQAVAAGELIGRQVNAAYDDSKLFGSPLSAMIIRRGTLVLLGGVGFVLLIACVNLATLVSTKVLGRTREVAIRLALGASRLRVARQLVIETALLAAAGAAGGLLLATTLLGAAEAMLPDADTFFRARESRSTMRGAAGLTQVAASMIALDAATLIFAAGAGLACSLLVAFLPAFQASVLRPIAALKAAASTVAGSGAARFDIRGPLVVAQVALALVLLAGSGLMLKSVWELRSTDVGINPDGVLRVRFSLPPGAYPTEARPPFYATLIERIRAVPGVESVAVGNCTPAGGGCSATGIGFDGPVKPKPGLPLVGVYWASPDYLETLGVRLLSGRTFTGQDRVGRPKVALVNEAAARRFWPNANPIGRTIALGIGEGFDDGAEVIGVVANVRYEGVESAPVPDVYIPLLQSPNGSVLFVRSRIDTSALVASIRREVRALDPNLPLTSIQTMEEIVGDAIWQPRASAWLLSAFAILAVLLTAIGIFGVMAQTVSQRTAEFGIRLAIGAQARDVLTLVLRRAAVLTGVGLAIGLAGAFLLSSLIASLLYNVTARDPRTFAAVVVILASVTLIAAYVPARRATRVDAMRTLRAD
jgi:putative ABC transport system permease protein